MIIILVYHDDNHKFIQQNSKPGQWPHIFFEVWPVDQFEVWPVGRFEVFPLSPIYYRGHSIDLLAWSTVSRTLSLLRHAADERYYLVHGISQDFVGIRLLWGYWRNH